MEKFKVGDKVIAKKGAPYGITTDGWTGFVVGFYNNLISVAEKPDSSKAWFVNPKWFDLLEQPKIVITTDGKTTLARLYDGKKVSKTATAVCSPDDTFDFMTGAKLAFERLTGDDNEIKVGDRVKVVDIGECYSSYKNWLTENAAEFAPYWSFKVNFGDVYSSRQLNDDYPKFKVVAKAPHEDNNDMLYLIQDFAQRCFIIGEKGIKKIEVKEC